jgi:hypothetical protein
MSKIELIFYQTEDGQQPTLDVIEELAAKGKRGDNVYRDMAKYIRLGLVDLQTRGIDDWPLFDGYTFVTPTKTGLRTFKLIKRLEHNEPLFEFRVNQKRNVTDKIQMGYAFRMVFFIYQAKDTQYIIFTDATIKRTKSDPEFNQMVKDSLLIYKRFIENPSHYLEG